MAVQLIRSALLALMLGIAAPALCADILVFSRTSGFRHASISDGQTMLATLAAEQGHQLLSSEDPGVFTDSGLAPFSLVVFLSTTGDVLNEAQQAAFERWLEAGGGFLGIHAAADCEYDWPWYGAQVLGNGAWFRSHPAIQPATLLVELAGDVSTAHLPASFSFTDEWYNFRANPRVGAEVLLRLDEQSYDPGANAMGADHPISWRRPVAKGRSFYTGLGHRSQTFSDQRFVQHVAGGMRWALGEAAGGRVFADGFEAPQP